MERIVSGTTKERIVRTLILTGWVGVFGGWFLLDGVSGYPKDNLEKAVAELVPLPEQTPEIHPDITKESVERFAETFKSSRLTQRELIEDRGEAGWTSPRHDELRYFGPGGQMIVTLAGDLVTGVEFQDGAHTETDLDAQLYLGAVLLAIAAVMMIQTVRVLMTRVELDDSGLKMRGRAVIPFSAMTELDTEDYRRKGYLDVIYKDGDKSGSVRLDDYVHRAFRPIVSTICEKCGFENPIDKKDKEKAAEEAGDDD